MQGEWKFFILLLSQLYKIFFKNLKNGRPESKSHFKKKKKKKKKKCVRKKFKKKWIKK